MAHSVAEKIRHKIESQNLSVMGLEKKAGLKVHAVQNILSGQSKKPNVDTLVAVANALGCTLSDLIDGAPASKTSSSNSKTDSFSNWELLEEINIYVVREMKKIHNNISPLVFSETIQEIYAYCEDIGNGAFDKGFATWVLKRLK